MSHPAYHPYDGTNQPITRQIDEACHRATLLIDDTSAFEHEPLHVEYNEIFHKDRRDDGNMHMNTRDTFKSHSSLAQPKTKLPQHPEATQPRRVENINPERDPLVQQAGVGEHPYVDSVTGQDSYNFSVITDHYGSHGRKNVVKAMKNCELHALEDGAGVDRVFEAVEQARYEERISEPGWYKSGVNKAPKERTKVFSTDQSARNQSISVEPVKQQSWIVPNRKKSVQVEQETDPVLLEGKEHSQSKPRIEEPQVVVKRPISFEKQLHKSWPNTQVQAEPVKMAATTVNKDKKTRANVNDSVTTARQKRTLRSRQVAIQREKKKEVRSDRVGITILNRDSNSNVVDDQDSHGEVSARDGDVLDVDADGGDDDDYSTKWNSVARSALPNHTSVPVPAVKYDNKHMQMQRANAAAYLASPQDKLRARQYLRNQGDMADISALHDNGNAQGRPNQRNLGCYNDAKAQALLGTDDILINPNSDAVDPDEVADPLVQEETSMLRGAVSNPYRYRVQSGVPLQVDLPYDPLSSIGSTNTTNTANATTNTANATNNTANTTTNTLKTSNNRKNQPVNKTKKTAGMKKLNTPVDPNSIPPSNAFVSALTGFNYDTAQTKLRLQRKLRLEFDGNEGHADAASVYDALDELRQVEGNPQVQRWSVSELEALAKELKVHKLLTSADFSEFIHLYSKEEREEVVEDMLVLAETRANDREWKEEQERVARAQKRLDMLYSCTRDRQLLPTEPVPSLVQQGEVSTIKLLQRDGDHNAIKGTARASSLVRAPALVDRVIADVSSESEVETYTKQLQTIREQIRVNMANQTFRVKELVYGATSDDGKEALHVKPKPAKPKSVVAGGGTGAVVKKGLKKHAVDMLPSVQPLYAIPAEPPVLPVPTSMRRTDVPKVVPKNSSLGEQKTQRKAGKRSGAAVVVSEPVPVTMHIKEKKDSWTSMEPTMVEKLHMQKEDSKEVASTSTTTQAPQAPDWSVNILSALVHMQTSLSKQQEDGVNTDRSRRKDVEEESVARAYRDDVQVISLTREQELAQSRYFTPSESAVSTNVGSDSADITSNSSSSSHYSADLMNSRDETTTNVRNSKITNSAHKKSTPSTSDRRASASSAATLALSSSSANFSHQRDISPDKGTFSKSTHSILPTESQTSRSHKQDQYSHRSLDNSSTSTNLHQLLADLDVSDDDRSFIASPRGHNTILQAINVAKTMDLSPYVVKSKVALFRQKQIHVLESMLHGSSSSSSSSSVSGKSSSIRDKKSREQVEKLEQSIDHDLSSLLNGQLQQSPNLTHIHTGPSTGSILRGNMFTPFNTSLLTDRELVDTVLQTTLLNVQDEIDLEWKNVLEDVENMQVRDQEEKERLEREDKILALLSQQRDSSENQQQANLAVQKEVFLETMASNQQVLREYTQAQRKELEDTIGGVLQGIASVLAGMSARMDHMDSTQAAVAMKLSLIESIRQQRPEETLQQQPSPLPYTPGGIISPQPVYRGAHDSSIGGNDNRNISVFPFNQQMGRIHYSPISVHSSLLSGSSDGSLQESYTQSQVHSQQSSIDRDLSEGELFQDNRKQWREFHTRPAVPIQPVDMDLSDGEVFVGEDGTAMVYNALMEETRKEQYGAIPDWTERQISKKKVSVVDQSVDSSIDGGNISAPRKISVKKPGVTITNSTHSSTADQEDSNNSFSSITRLASQYKPDHTHKKQPSAKVTSTSTTRRVPKSQVDYLTAPDTSRSYDSTNISASHKPNIPLDTSRSEGEISGRMYDQSTFLSLSEGE